MRRVSTFVLALAAFITRAEFSFVPHDNLVSQDANRDTRDDKSTAQDKNPFNSCDDDPFVAYNEEDSFFVMPDENEVRYMEDEHKPVAIDDYLSAQEKNRAHHGSERGRGGLLNYHEGDRFFVMPDEDGNVHIEDSQPDLNINRRFFSDWALARFFLYTRRNTTAPEEFDTDRLDNMKFNPNLPTKVVVHGWRGNLTSTVNDLIKNGFLAAGDVNVIVVDWSDGSFAPYVASYLKVESVGTQIERMLRTLFTKFGRNYEDADLHLVGHSLGAHVVGFAGRKLGGKVDRITGLDPALPKWEKSKSGRLNKTDAKYVEVVHTNAGIAGQIETVGHADFYPNGGTKMPGCSYFDVACSHGRSYEYFAESLTRDAFVGRDCKNEELAMQEACQGRIFAKMGTVNAHNPLIRGIFYMETNAEPPFGMNASL